MSQPTSQTTVPPFSCKLPPDLLDGLGPRDRYLHESIDEMRQAIAWSCNLSASTANRVEEVYQQTLYINGSVKQAKADIVELKAQVVAQKAETAPVVKAYGIGKTLAKSRLFWVGAAAFVLIVLPYLVSLAPAPAAFIKAAVGVFLAG